MKICVLTTSYPRFRGDAAGRFVEEAVGRLRTAGCQVVVVSPDTFSHFGIAYGDGIANNLRARPWKVLLLPLFLLALCPSGAASGCRRGCRPCSLVAVRRGGLATRKPMVVQAWGSDVELGRRLPWLFRPLLRRARVVLCGSSSLAEDVRALGGATCAVLPSGVDIPEAVGPPAEPPHILYVGRLSEEKGIAELVRAAADLPLVVVGDGPLRDLVPSTVGFVLHDELGPYYERAAIVVAPSRREGYGVVVREAMAYGRAVVASDVGGLRDAIDDGVTGRLVPPRDPAALRAALTELIGDPALRRRLGDAARAHAQAAFAWEACIRDLTRLYASVAG